MEIENFIRNNTEHYIKILEEEILEFLEFEELIEGVEFELECVEIDSDFSVNVEYGENEENIFLFYIDNSRDDADTDEDY
tara:strand:- start:287 stop:526 length:240 start_codon:yes stop_codon:yes gene_type:complete